MMLPLDGFRVLDLTRFLSGPYCTLVLAELGADVIKVEQPHTGDDSRRLAPKVNGESYPSAMPNRSKRSVSLDLKTEEGLAGFRELVKTADVVIENFRPGVATKLGIDYEQVKALREDIIYCSISGFGQTGPYRHRPGFDIMAQGLSGLMRMTGDGQRPAKVGIAINDIAAGATAAYSILGAHIHRMRTGEGQSMDISLVEAGLAWTVWESGAYFGSGEVPQATGTRHRRSTPYQAFRTSDGFVTIGAANDRLWERLATTALERPEWLEDPRFATLPDRMANIEELEAEIEAITVTRTTDEWIEAVDRAGVPCGPVLTYDDALADPQIVDRGVVTEVEHPIIGPMKTIGPPTKFSNLPEYGVRGPAPWLGQHTTELLREVGVDEEAIEAMYASGAAFDAHPDLQQDRPEDRGAVAQPASATRGN
ncbi:CaiB/BaiF CoA transferase family protein [Ornithinicoccus hortensis]|uniref:Crotonobetainyl-CoA:carnitine CoA-transferase CaiB-like acyl-CoA transferase n=1 Tax=Ornithinicoccus hortensis TaxID=82346 RepID=A0A542YR01_9MICO|nr:CaiB/BaiF CoA-transferase family protein [Ornithinicoccus hortensis]TQL50487.1 crotonobetainyl-CoA:carnitine CoA-transferase CaiB-like acyl-CoA transferase [Ornithinicoccus hortensis]